MQARSDPLFAPRFNNVVARLQGAGSHRSLSSAACSVEHFARLGPHARAGLADPWRTQSEFN